jgi:prepilin-type N-terminal cleavage/methylation domain-containing protein
MEVCMVRMEGFTLLELVACLALLATVAGAGALRLSDVLASARLAGSVQRLSAGLRQARGRALERGSPVDVQLDDAGAFWQVRDVSGAPVTREALPGGVVFAGLPASRRVRFSALGTTDNATITLGAGAVTRRIVVNQRGRVRVQ